MCIILLAALMLRAGCVPMQCKGVFQQSQVAKCTHGSMAISLQSHRHQWDD